MADDGESNFRKKEREPITTVCFIILVIACIAVLCIYVNDHYISDDKETVEYGDSVDVNYTGSLYTYYDDSSSDVKAVIFDTSVEKVADNDAYLFCSSFTAKSSYSASTITLGQHKFLAAFENAIIGHDVGDTVKVKISAADAYANSYPDTEATHSTIMNMSAVYNMTSSDFKELFGVTAPTQGVLNFTYDGIKDADGNGVSMTATYNSNGTIDVIYGLAYSTTYTISDNELGKVTITTFDAPNGNGSLSYTIAFENVLYTGNNVTVGDVTVPEIEMISIHVFPSDSINFIGYDKDNGIVAYDSGTGTATFAQMDLYFVITIVAKN